MVNNTIVELENNIRYHNECYTNNIPEISDAEYDELIIQLTALCPQSETLTEVGCLPSFGKTIQHTIPMGSLPKINFELDEQGNYVGDGLKELTQWVDKHQEEKVWSMKIDGCAGELTYKNGNLVAAASRGDGNIGQDLTNNIRIILDNKEIEPFKGIKHFVKDVEIKIRGEFYIPRSFFNKYLAHESANPRNSTSGALNHSNPLKTKEKGVCFKPYRLLLNDEEIESLTTAEKIVNSLTGRSGVKEANFTFVPLHKSKLTLEKIEDLDKERKDFDFETDGIVLSINNTEERESYGAKGKYPNGAVAFKFKAEQIETKVIGIDWTPSRIRRISPVARLEPIHLAGTTVSAATLNNYGWITNNMKIAIGDTVLVEKAGDIIPKIIRVTNRVEDRTNINLPTVCPVCGVTTEITDTHIFCNNKLCRTKQIGDIVHWVNTLELKDPQWCVTEALYDKGFIKDVADLYYLNEEEIKDIPRCNATVMIDELISNSEIHLGTFLRGLGIEGVGSSYYKIAIEKFNTLEAIRNITDPAELIELQLFGEITALKLINGLKELSPLIDKLLNVVEVIPYEVTTGKLLNKTFCLTGTLSKKRKILEKEIIENGGSIKSVSKNLDYLICGEKAGSKKTKAEKLGITILTEEQYSELL